MRPEVQDHRGPELWRGSPSWQTPRRARSCHQGRHLSRLYSSFSLASCRRTMPFSFSASLSESSSEEEGLEPFMSLTSFRVGGLSPVQDARFSTTASHDLE